MKFSQIIFLALSTISLVACAGNDFAALMRTEGVPQNELDMAFSEILLNSRVGEVSLNGDQASAFLVANNYINKNSKYISEILGEKLDLSSNSFKERTITFGVRKKIISIWYDGRLMPINCHNDDYEEDSCDSYELLYYISSAPEIRIDVDIVRSDVVGLWLRGNAFPLHASK